MTGPRCAIGRNPTGVVIESSFCSGSSYVNWWCLRVRRWLGPEGRAGRGPASPGPGLGRTLPASLGSAPLREGRREFHIWRASREARLCCGVSLVGGVRLRVVPPLASAYGLTHLPRYAGEKPAAPPATHLALKEGNGVRGGPHPHMRSLCHNPGGNSRIRTLRLALAPPGSGGARAFYGLSRANRAAP